MSSSSIEPLVSSSRCRGYSVAFVYQPPKEVETECPICCDVLFQPKVVTCCGISFCAGCIGLIERDGKPCPHCRGSFISYDDKKLRRTLNGYKVFCPYKEKGCKWIGELSQCDVHLDQSGLLTQSANRCLFHEVCCHLCRTKCERRLMPDHLSNDCPHRDVECRYHFMGCEFKRPQQEMEDHLRESIDSHLLLAAKSIIRIRNDLKNEAKKQQKKQLAEVYRLKELQESQLDVVHNMLEKQRERQLDEVNELKKQQERQFGELKLQERKLAEANELNRRQLDELLKQQETMQEQFTELKRKHGQLERKNRIIAGCLALAIIVFIVAGTVNQILSTTELPVLQAGIESAILNHIENVESHCGKERTAISNNEDHRDTINNGGMESSSDLQQLLPTVSVYYSYPELDKDVVLENIPSLTDTGVDVEADTDRNLKRKNSVYTDLDSESAYVNKQRNKDKINTEVDTNALPAENLLLSDPTTIVESELAVEEINLRESHDIVGLEQSDLLDSQIKKVVHVHVDAHVDMKNVCSMKDYFVDHVFMGSSSSICRASDNNGYADKGAEFQRSKVMDFKSSNTTVESHICKARDIFISNDVEWVLSPDNQKMDSDKVSHIDQVIDDSEWKGIHSESNLHSNKTYPDKTETDIKSRKVKRETDLNASEMKPSHIDHKALGIVHTSKAKVSHAAQKKNVHSTKETLEKESQGLLEVLQHLINYGLVICILVVVCTCFCLLGHLENQDRYERSVVYRPRIRRRYKRVY